MTETRKALRARLDAATMTPDILCAAANMAWYTLTEGKEDTCPTDDVPTGNDLCNFLMMAGGIVQKKVMEKSCAALRTLYDVKAASWYSLAMALTDVSKVDNRTGSSTGLVAEIVSETHLSTEGTLLLSRRIAMIDQVHARWVQHRTDGGTGKHPLAPLVHAYLHEKFDARRLASRKTRVTATKGWHMSRRPRIVSQATTGPWSQDVHAAPPVDGECLAIRGLTCDVPVYRQIAKPQGELFALPTLPRDARLARTGEVFDTQFPTLRGDTLTLLTVAHAVETPVHLSIRQIAELLARTRTGGYRRPQETDMMRAWKAGRVLRVILIYEQRPDGSYTGRWRPLANVDTRWNDDHRIDPDRDALIIGPPDWLRMRRRGGPSWTLTASGSADAYHDRQACSCRHLGTCHGVLLGGLLHWGKRHCAKPAAMYIRKRGTCR